MATARPGRYTSRTMRLLLLAFVVVPLVDLYLLVRLGAWVGALPVLAFVIVSAVWGFSLARREGLRVLRRWQKAVAQRQVPEEGLMSGLLVLVGGVLFIVPGVLTDVLGLVLLAPPGRRWIAGRVRRRLERAVERGQVQVRTWTARTGDLRSDIVDADFEESPPDRPRLPQ